MERRNGKDESSIRPVSSLRSRFENLDKDSNPPPASPIGGRSPFLSGAPPIANRRPSTPAAEIAGLDSAAPMQTQQLAATPKRRPGLPKSRPHSMISVTPSQKVPPLVTVDSPRSPGKFKTMSVDLRQAPNLAATTPVRADAESPTEPFARPFSRAATPALEARMSALLQATEAPKAQSEGAQTGPPTPDLKPSVKTSSVPPPVNRAGKPNVPTKPVTLVQKPDNLSAPEAAAELSDRSISPFNTPPGSGKSSPSRERFGSNATRARNESDASFVSRIRTDSDASFVERVRTDSDASSSLRGRFGSTSSFAERARAGSNASFVEPSSLPESWQNSQSPPMHHYTTARLEPQANGAARPARYRPVAATDRPPAVDVTDDRPRLPSRPELQMRPGRASPPKTRSGRTSPVKELFQQRLGQGPQRSATFDGAGMPPRIPANKPPPQRSALAQGFDHTATLPAASPAHIAPAVPAPRRSLDRRRDVSNPVPAVNGHSYDDDADAPPPDPSGAPTISLSDYPDSSNASRRPPRYKQRPYQIPTEYDTRTFAVCGEQLLDLEHNEIVKISSLVFKPSTSAEDDGKRIWLGTTIGEIHELDIPSQSIVKTRANAHTRKDIIRMFRYASELWTLDDSGDLNVWKPDRQGAVSLDSQYNPFRTPRGHTYSIALGAHLWIATGKEIRVFAPSASSDTEFQVLRSPLCQTGTGEIHSGATLSGKPDLVYFGHQDGKVSIYNRNDFSCTSVVNVSVYKLSSLAGVGDYLWAGFNTGMAYVYDTSVTPWRVKNDWRAHEKQICGISAERSAVWKLDRLQVITLGTDNMLKIWDGMLEEDWLESRMQEHDSAYCSFSDLTAAVLTWNAGATKPTHMQHTSEDKNFFREYLSFRDPPDIFIFGFQELVDLEDKKVTAKSFFKSKKKDANEQEHMSHQYRAWRDHLTRCLEEFLPPTQSYVLLHNASMVGLFTCVFVKSPLRNHIKHVHTAEVKRGMKGYHGNKGALVVRMVLDDSSLCFVNCHLAAGQTETMHRNNDIAEILESEALPSYPLSNQNIAQHADVFTSGGDGSMILDHEICILNGDLNYRIDTMGRDTVIKHINQNNLARLLERDQLLLTKRKNPGFRLRAFQESEITFAPTYKYNLQSDDYDSSEKRRAPAWCDRILYRGVGKVQMEEYRRWEVRVSDHRPVSGKLKMRVKTVDEARRAPVWDLCHQEFEAVRRRVARSVQ
ncbi:hypothetical protein LTR37_014834 [Vermiconidia calcicola]|uniref:Uncharacterized protein n=1 Tax=Vermiconidia calcicola TaxID=1690605 RepID=A0ACC3MSK4_9PEZI|nr:hypothetical protein LTR37_014834 [Vermiconidia calcicola]